MGHSASRKRCGPRAKVEIAGSGRHPDAMPKGVEGGARTIGDGGERRISSVRQAAWTYARMLWRSSLRS